MSERFAIFITKAPYDSRNPETALQFCIAAVENGHTVEQVFFYSAAIHTASKLLLPNSDELNQREAWKHFSTQYKVPLYVCSTAATRRGLVSDDDMLDVNNYDPMFSAVGMIEYFAALRDPKLIGVQF
ncbi:sulfurtransferase complex subunit TusD [Agaribacter flavus]|uniref:Sulfurtransferase complex subunit TusD n=1 Tax=Agaribacter flavus TaxID=1902781 RepID=A0ABV7FSS2_9ALTE